MNITALPGTTIKLHPKEHSVRELLSSLFLAGGLVLSQVSSLTGLPAHMLQNWVKRGFVSPPVNKKYSKRQFCRIVIINFLKDNLQINHIVRLIAHVNGNLADESDDLIDDCELYCCFVDTITLAESEMNRLDGALAEVLRCYEEPYPGARKKLETALRVMATMYISSQMKSSAELLLRTME